MAGRGRNRRRKGGRRGGRLAGRADRQRQLHDGAAAECQMEAIGAPIGRMPPVGVVQVQRQRGAARRGEKRQNGQDGCRSTNHVGSVKGPLELPEEYPVRRPLSSGWRPQRHKMHPERLRDPAHAGRLLRGEPEAPFVGRRLHDGGQFARTHEAETSPVPSSAR